MEPKKATHYNYFVVFWLLCSHFVTDMIMGKKDFIETTKKLQFL